MIRRDICLYIPSLYRAAALSDILSEIQMNSIPQWCCVIVAVERFKDPDSWKVASSFSDIDGIQVINGKGEGFPGAFLHVFEVAETKYVIHLSDEESPDFLALNGLIPLLQAESPGALITNFEIITKNRATIKYRNFKDRLVAPSDLLYCMHNPGMVWSTEKVRELMPTIVELKNHFPTIYKYYPHLLILTLMLPESSIFFNSSVISRQVRFFDKNHEINLQGDFKSLVNRWLFLNEINQLIRYLDNRNEYKSVVSGLSRAITREVFPMLHRAQCDENNLSFFIIFKSAVFYWSGLYRLNRFLKKHSYR